MHAHVLSTNSDCWWWELVITGKRLIMTGAIVLFQQGSVMQFTVGLITTFVFYGLQVRSTMVELFVPSFSVQRVCFCDPTLLISFTRSDINHTLTRRRTT